MYNLVYLIGRLTGDVKNVEREDGTKEAQVTLAVQRSYKNVDGVYETDFVKCTLLKGIAENVIEYCKKGDLVGIRGRIESNNLEDGEVEVKIVTEKVSFLTTAKNKDNDNEKDLD